MSTLQLTPKMKLALERLYETSGHEDWINMYTGVALRARGLVAVNMNTRSTAGGRFPEHMTKLLPTGVAWCQRHFANVRRPDKHTGQE